MPLSPMSAGAGLEAMQLTNLRHCRFSGAPAASRPRAAGPGPRLAAVRPGSGGGGGSGEGASSTSTASFSMLRALADSAILGAAENVELLWSAVEAGATRVRRTLEPPPPGFPPGPSGDSALSLLRDPLAFLASTQARHGDVVGLLLGGERAVLVADPAVARDVLIDRAALFVKEGTAFFPGSSLAGNGLLVSDGDVWRRQRQLANPAFRRAAVERYGEAMAAEAVALAGRRWSSSDRSSSGAGGRNGLPGNGGTAGQAVRRDVYRDFNELTLRITLCALFGEALEGEGSEQALEITESIRVAFEHFATRAATAFIIPEFVPTPDNLAFGAAVSRLDRAVYRLIGQRRRSLAAAPRPASDLLDSLLLARDEEGAGMGDRALRDELMTLLVAGQETSAILLGWAAALLAAHPAAQAAAAAEVAAALGGRAVGPSDVARLPYLESVALEALRLQPPAYLVGRCASEEVVLAGRRLPRGTTVLVSPYLLHRDPGHWEAPEAFRPERWLSLMAEAGGKGGGSGGGGERRGPGSMAFLSGMGPNGAYVPFGAGPRNCIGAGFAMMEAVLVLAAVLQRYCLELPPGGAFPAAEPRITLRPHSVELLIRERPAPAAAGAAGPAPAAALAYP